MRAFERTGDLIESDLDGDEVALLGSLASSLIELLGGEPEEPETSDPLEALQAEMDGGVVMDTDDPAIARLFPEAYPDDPAASADFRRYTAEDGRRERVSNAGVVLDDLAATRGGSLLLRIPSAHTDAWMKTLNALRITLASRLDIVMAEDAEAIEDLPEDDPMSYLAAVYEWLGAILESLLDAMYS